MAFVGDISIVNGVHKPTFTSLLGGSTLQGWPWCFLQCSSCAFEQSEAGTFVWLLGTRPTDVRMDRAGENDEKIGQAKEL